MRRYSALSSRRGIPRNRKIVLPCARSSRSVTIAPTYGCKRMPERSFVTCFASGIVNPERWAGRRRHAIIGVFTLNRCSSTGKIGHFHRDQPNVLLQRGVQRARRAACEAQAGRDLPLCHAQPVPSSKRHPGTIILAFHTPPILRSAQQTDVKRIPTRSQAHSTVGIVNPGRSAETERNHDPSRR